MLRFITNQTQRSQTTRFLLRLPTFIKLKMGYNCQRYDTWIYRYFTINNFSQTR